MNRRMVRETIMQLYYQMEIHNAFDGSIGKEILEDLIIKCNKSNMEYAKKMYDAFLVNKENIDLSIKENLSNWNINRISKIDLSILRVALVEILFFDEIPITVSINEAVELGKKYGTDNSPSFINGILGSLLKSKEKSNEE